MQAAAASALQHAAAASQAVATAHATVLLQMNEGTRPTAAAAASPMAAVPFVGVVAVALGMGIVLLRGRRASYDHLPATGEEAAAGTAAAASTGYGTSSSA